MNHRALCAWCLAIAAVLAHVNVSEADEPAAWTAVPVPGCWEDAADGQFAGHDGYAWYRCLVKIPPHWRGRNLKLLVEHVDNVHEAFFNGVKVGGAGKFPSDYQNGIEVAAEYDVLAEHVRPADTNLLAIRVYDHDGRGGFKGIAPAVISGIDAISLAGDWEFRTGDDADWSDPAKSLPTVALAAFEQVGETALLKEKSKDGPLSPAEALAKFIVPDDLQAEVVLSEPLVAQPLYITFDERGRMWVAQYLQYPFPAGLKILSEDKFLRATYDKVPPPPPNHFVGADKITIHEDTDGDGAFDQHKTFVDGLNICVAALPAYDGVWVMNPPYLLFYPDRNHDDVPDGDPEVHLQGFGMEDTHSVASNLQFGPDGWIYASQGSTVSGDIIRPGLDKKPVHSLGQLIWRYHPPTKRYEIFAEGGGNAFGVEIDSQGRVFSGHNGGDTRGFHYVQGGYYQKGFGKHGPLSNPFTFGYFPAMKHPAVPRFTHTYVINEGGALGAAHEGNMFAVAPLQGQVIESDLQRDGSTFQTTDIVHSMTTPDTRFRPVEIKIGPDGALYVGDWYEEQIAHLRHHEGRIDPTNGRIYRLKAKGAKPIAPFDLSQKSSAELVEVLSHPNKWFRRMALRLLAERRDASIVPSLKKLLAEHNGQLALEALWALNLSGGFDEATALAALDHPFAPVRTWTVRLLGDEGRVSSAMAARLASLAKDEAYVDVRSQLACTARRLPAAQCLPIVKALVAHDEDLNDPHLPLLLWWAIESKCESDPAAVVEFFVDPAVWKGKLAASQILARTMRRFASTGARQDLLTCAALFDRAPDDAGGKALMQGFEEAFAGRPLANLPDELASVLDRFGGGSVVLGLRQGRADAIEQALAVLNDDQADRFQRLQFLQIVGEVKTPACLPALLRLVAKGGDDELRVAALSALQLYDDPRVPQAALGIYSLLSLEAQSVAQAVLGSRKAWALALLEAVEAGQIDKATIPVDTVRKLTIHRDDRLAELVAKHWGTIDGETTAEMKQLIERLVGTVSTGSGSPYDGKKLYTASCGKCHTLLGQGGKIGPDLTAYKRDDFANMLVHIVNPSAEIREGFGTYVALTADGRAVTGFLADKDNQIIVLRTAEGQSVSIPQDEIDELLPQKKSLMPEGLLKDLSEQQVRDLFAYLRSTQPLSE